MKEYDEVHVFDGISERTGTIVEVPGSSRHLRACSSLTDLIRKYHLYGDGHYYLRPKQWPGEETSIDLRRPYWPSMEEAVEKTRELRRGRR